MDEYLHEFEKTNGDIIQVLEPYEK